MTEYLEILRDIREFTISLPYIGGRYRDKRTLKQKVQDTNISSLNYRKCVSYHRLITNIIRDLEDPLTQKERLLNQSLTMIFGLELEELNRYIDHYNLNSFITAT